MTKQVKTTPEVEEKTPNTEVSSAETKEVATLDTGKETIGAVLNTESKEKVETVPLSSYLEMKKDNKALAKKMEELKQSIEEGATKKEVSTDIKALADKHGVDADFLQEYAQTIKANAEKDFDDKISSTIKPLQEKEKAEKIDKAFNTAYSKAMESMTEYEGIANKEVIKTLSLNPANANKTFSQLIEEAYGHVVPAKKSIEGSSARAGKDDTLSVDNSRTKDPSYFKEVMENPLLKEKYNSGLTDRLSKFL